METFGIIGMIFGLGAMGIVYELKKKVETLKKDVEELKKRDEK
jgi:hypothetical protein